MARAARPRESTAAASSAPVERQLPVVALARPQLLLQEPQHEIAEIERPLAGQREVRGQRRVARHPAQPPTPGARREQRALDVVRGLGPGRVGQPAPRARARRRCRAAPARRTPPRRPRRRSPPRRGRRCRGPTARRTATPERPVAVWAANQAPSAPAAGRSTVDVDALVGLGLGRRQRRVQPLAQHPELQGVEDLVHLVAVPGLRAPGRRSRTAGRAHRRAR